MKQAVEALTYVHLKGVLHCDFHPTNFFIDEFLGLEFCLVSWMGELWKLFRFFFPRGPMAMLDATFDLTY
ncbi:hypothetical protein BDY21DRAFT_343774 [Lineolata rhizophorae]|uniref:Protein kinase domain-containing protein n=1 Tax=Lineolata rhizophorae TaxID=578093 RepID=A0A6A6P1R2_9PEZI|nr:hypothetical protein BDY21DRAFT_343774 [Lineolata rhizophorae]